MINSGFRERISYSGLDGVVVVAGYPVRTVPRFYFPDRPNEYSWDIKSLFQQEVIKRGVLIGTSQILSLAHTEKEIEYILDAYEDSLGILAEALETDSVVERLEGDPVQPILIRPH